MISIRQLIDSSFDSGHIVVRFAYDGIIYNMVISQKKIQKAFYKYSPSCISLKNIIKYSNPTVYYRKTMYSYSSKYGSNDIEVFWLRLHGGSISSELSMMNDDEIECILTLDGFEKCDTLQDYIEKHFRS